MIATNQPADVAKYPADIRDAGRSLTALLPYVGAVRNFGPTSWQIADVASGRLDGFWQYGPDDNDLVGGALVATEAGLSVTDLDGQPWKPGATGFLAAPTQLHGRLLELLHVGPENDSR
jgi:myo-inositol-1(or 4)-monophosphatase